MISIHTLRMEGDHDNALVIHTISRISIHTLGFFPSSLRRISIHTLRMEGDSSGVMAKMANRNFNPHPPHGG